MSLSPGGDKITQLDQCVVIQFSDFYIGKRIRVQPRHEIDLTAGAPTIDPALTAGTPAAPINRDQWWGDVTLLEHYNAYTGEKEVPGMPVVPNAEAHGHWLHPLQHKRMSMEATAVVAMGMQGPLRDLPANFTKENYCLRMHNLLCIEQAYTDWLLARRYDRTATILPRLTEGRQGSNTVYYGDNDIVCALNFAADKSASHRSLTDARPSVMPGDIAMVRTLAIRSGKLQRGLTILEGRVVEATRNTVTIRFPNTKLHQDTFPVLSSSVRGLVSGLDSGEAFLKLNDHVQTKQPECLPMFAIRFRQNDLPFLMMHRAVDLVPLHLLFPTMDALKAKQWKGLHGRISRKDLVNTSLDDAQLGLVNSILAGTTIRVPTVCTGAFGCGKSATLVEAVRQIVRYVHYRSGLLEHIRRPMP